MDPDQMVDTSGLEPEDFGASDLGRVFSVIRKRVQAGEPVDAVLVSEESGVEIDVLELSPASFAPISTYVQTIKAAADRRRGLGVLEEARGRLAAGGDPVGHIAGALDRLLSGRGGGSLRGSGEVVRSYRDEFSRRSAGRVGIPYGIEPIDSLLLPLRAGRLVVFASRPGIGKTALAESVGDSAARHGPVLFVSLEMMAEELLDRGMARTSGINAQSIIRGEVAIDKLDEHLKSRSDLPLTYLDEGGTTTSDILSAAQRVKMMNKGDLALIIVDYLQLVADKGENEVYRVGGISHALKNMAMKLKVPVLAMAQLNRNIESEGRKPRLSDLRDSGAIEQDADVVLIMTGSPYKPERELHVLKQRQGGVGIINLNFDGDTQRWTAPIAVAERW